MNIARSNDNVEESARKWSIAPLLQSSKNWVCDNCAQRVALNPDAIVLAMACPIEEPADVDVNEITVRPTAGAQ